ncbi:glycosyltransferase [Roseicyclus marinus]|uniref:glycosyltransferase n=1 Tax=Roseicyclus marinus TaxID=2161673 RepID=UPI00240FCAD2|nr:glycosyltransferase [Roseicyclus marinus]MDG3042469.1 glycosyltransferase [Roseicyclus marinus]
MKQCSTLAANSGISQVVIAALWEDDLPPEENLVSGVVVRRLRLRSRNWGRSLPIQLIKYLEFLIRVLLLAFRLRVSAISCHALALLPLGATVKLLTRARLIYDAHELETERAGLHGLRKRLSQIVERRLIPYCDHTFVVSESIHNDYVARYGLSRISTVMNCPHRLEHRPVSSRFRDIFSIPDSDVIFLYQGLLDEGRGLRLMLDAFKLLQARSNTAHLHLVIMGYGPMKEEIEQMAAHVPCIHLHPGVAPDQVLDYTASADIGLSLIEPISLSYAYSLPNKLFEYLACGLHVLCADLPEIRRHADNLNITLLPKLSAEALAGYCIVLSKGNKANTSPLPKQYSWEYQGEVMMQAYRTCLTDLATLTVSEERASDA